MTSAGGDTGQRAGQRAGQKARAARDQPAVHGLARVGMAAYGLLYVVVAWLAAHLALGDRDGTPSGEGAFQQLARQPAGRWALWAVAAGLGCLVLRQALQAVGGHRDRDGLRRTVARLASAGRGVVFAVLAFLAVRTALGEGGGGRRAPQGLTVDLMSLPLGPAVVVAVGAGIVGVGLASGWRALGDRWRRDLEADGRTGPVGAVVAFLARAGNHSRGVAFMVIGALFGWAGLTHDPRRSGGLDQAIVRLRDEPYGRWAILAVALGLGCYGAYHVVRGWYLRRR